MHYRFVSVDKSTGSIAWFKAADEDVVDMLGGWGPHFKETTGWETDVAAARRPDTHATNVRLDLGDVGDVELEGIRRAIMSDTYLPGLSTEACGNNIWFNWK